MANSFGFSLDITVTIDVLQDKILQVKILKAIFFIWFHNDSSEKNNSLSDRSNEPQINE